MMISLQNSMPSHRQKRRQGITTNTHKILFLKRTGWIYVFIHAELQPFLQENKKIPLSLCVLVSLVQKGNYYPTIHPTHRPTNRKIIQPKKDYFREVCAHFFYILHCTVTTAYESCLKDLLTQLQEKTFWILSVIIKLHVYTYIMHCIYILHA